MKLPRRLNKPGPLIDYLMDLYATGDPTAQRAAKDAIKAVKVVAATPDGAILLDLLEKATTDFFLAPSSDPSACDALNAQRFIALDLRRIVSDEIERVLEKHDAQRSGHGGRLPSRTGRR